MSDLETWENESPALFDDFEYEEPSTVTVRRVQPLVGTLRYKGQDYPFGQTVEVAADVAEELFAIRRKGSALFVPVPADN